MTVRLKYKCQICSKAFEFQYLVLRHQKRKNSKCIIPEKLEDGEIEPNFDMSSSSTESDDFVDTEKFVGTGDATKINLYFSGN